MKKVKIASLSAFVLVAFSASMLFANPKLLTQHKAVTGADKKIASCNDCHNAKTRLEKKKGQNYKALFKTASCAAKGCHK